ncbi:hypothetical protein CISIN_1g001503mg [Citrus sinensis]|uniref:FACT complex subunit n=1 Tax=Citrus sinensis TaxID=2711 RepID=A0A067E286_CITSI|nr:hypothetical protein CISIN_1g001503mg [Citrus sinensis]
MADNRNGNAQMANGTGGANAYSINLENFSTRLKALYSHWNKHKSDYWGSADVLAIATPPASEDLRYLKSSALNIWLLGYEFPETVMVFMKKQIQFLCSQKKASLLGMVKRSAKDAVGADVVIHVKAKTDDGVELMDAIFNAVRSQSNVDSGDGPIVGSIARETPEGRLLETWADRLQNSGFQLSDVTNGLSELFAVKDQEEIMNVKKAAVKDVAYSFNEDEEEEERPKVKAEANGTEALPSKTTLRSDNQEISKEELRRQHQAELARQKNEETGRRLAGGGSGAGDNRASAKTTTDLIAYKNVNDLLPPRDLMIQIDQKNEAVLFPIYGSMVPFHVATIRTVSSQQDTNRNCYIRIIFNVPGTPFNPHDTNSLKHQGAIYLKEVSFRSKDPRHIGEVVGAIKTLRRQVMARESERAERATLVTQEKLQLAGNRFKPIKLHDLWIRPVFGGRGRKIPGTLEAHLNGFRFATSRPEERVDIMFGNIKHAFFQPAEKEMITLVHFHLHNHIMVGNKKTKDVQFYVEVMDVVQTLGGGKRSAYDPDEIEEEQRERARKNKINMDFQSFVNRVNDLWGQPKFNGLDLEFDQPLRDLGFHGVPHKASAFIVPTSSCLVELIETPFLVVTLGEIEIVNLERVGLGQKNFDMTIVFKDFKKDVLRIDSIPSSSLDSIKEWLDTTDIKYYESRLNLNWRQILKTITDDPQSFIDDGGWEFLNLEASDSESENSEESDQGYEPSDMEVDSVTEDEDSDSESLVESEDEEEEDSEEDSEEEKGKTWAELEREATNADREKGDDSDSEEERKRRKGKTFGKSRGPPSGGFPKRTKLR